MKSLLFEAVFVLSVSWFFAWYTAAPRYMLPVYVVVVALFWRVPRR